MLRSAEKNFESVVSRHLTSYVQLVLNVFPSFSQGATQEQVEQIIQEMFSRLDSQFDHTAFLRDVSQAYSKPLELGAIMGAKDLPKSAKFAEDEFLLSVDWSLLDPDTANWLAIESSKLLTGIDETTKKAIRAQLLRGYLEGESRDQIAERLKGVMTDISDWRARLIAQTETISAHSQGAIQVYEKSGVVQGKRWVDGQAGACPTCHSLNGKIVGLKEEFEGGHYAPPAHPGCRCTVAPALSLPAKGKAKTKKPVPTKKPAEYDYKTTSWSNAKEKLSQTTKEELIIAEEDLRRALEAKTRPMKTKLEAFEKFARAYSKAQFELTGIPTAWNGQIDWAEIQGAAGVKYYECNIGISLSYFKKYVGNEPIRASLTRIEHIIIHELNHGVRGFNSGLYNRSGLQFLEEAATETLARASTLALGKAGYTSPVYISTFGLIPGQAYQQAVDLFRELAAKQGLTGEQLAFKLKYSAEKVFLEQGASLAQALDRYEQVLPGMDFVTQANLIDQFTPTPDQFKTFELSKQIKGLELPSAQ